MSEIKINKVFFLITIIVLFPWVQIVYAENIGHPGLDYKALGWIAIGAGILANIPFLLYIKVKKISVKELGGADEITRDLTHVYRPIMNYHMILNIAGYVAGIMHGFFFMNRIDPISISLMMVMSVLTFSGIILRFLKFRNIMILVRILHTQIIMSGLLVLLIILHILSEV